MKPIYEELSILGWDKTHRVCIGYETENKVFFKSRLDEKINSLEPRDEGNNSSQYKDIKE